MHIFVAGEKKKFKKMLRKVLFKKKKILKKVLQPCIVNIETKWKGIFVCFYYLL